MKSKIHKYQKINILSMSKKLLLLLLISTVSFAQNANRKFIALTQKNGIATIKTNDGEYQIHFLSNKIVENSFVPKGQTNNLKSEAVILNNIPYAFQILKNGTYLSFGTEYITVLINKNPFQITYKDNSNLTLLSEKSGYTKVNDSTETLSFNLDKSESLYGGGARALGMNRRGNRLQLYNRAHYGYETKAELMNFCIPLVMSSKLYAVHFDNPAIGYLDLDSKKDNTLTYETSSGRKTYQVIVGDSWTDLVSNYTDLTGKQPLLPRWALGNFSSRFGYHSQEEVENTIKKFEENKIPVDAIILDLYWFGKTVKDTMGNLDWDKDNFPNPDKMIADLNTKGVKTILITEPFILTTSSKWQEAVAKNVLVTDKLGKPATWDFYFGNTSVVDIFKPEGKEWFWNVYKRLINQGVGGMWGDLGEPEVFPSKVITAGGKADEVHNIYGHNWAKLIAEGYKKDFPTQRPFILMRAGYSGSQRFGMVPWSGDVSRSWGGLQSQMEIALQMGMQGLGYMHSDLGGFAGDYFDNELYLRWLQYGVFNPIFRPHAQEDVASEVARKDVATMSKANKLVELRYQLMPYNYTLSFDNNQKGTPLMRPLLFEEPTLTTVSGTYFWGNDFLITPITKPGVTSTDIYFPKSSNWFDFYTGEKHLAGTTENVKVNAATIPTFVRGGSFIPMIATIQNTSSYSLANFNLHFYFDETVKNSSGKLYNDDGTTPNAFEKGQYEILNFNGNNNGKSLVVKIAAVTGKNYTSTEKNISVLIHNIKAKRIFVNGKEQLNKTFSEPLQVNVTATNGTQEIKIEY
ncbi:TIM-barrel domain-containing protein [Flavobacterium sp.]|uniref:glycoside hydrolase family 31 protein n=1 Tax=Flavobacterium sp. TaxID=239 RepID=UPI0024891486|nr:TIM-barrel domain-containing protein [Flavobacterium sp.]MDI1316171.1 glycoside hydrolase family 31 protein [Flavobacterium sp.]